MARKLLTRGLLLVALVLAGRVAVLAIEQATSPVIACAKPPIFALRPVTRSCIQDPTVRHRGESYSPASGGFTPRSDVVSNLRAPN